MTVQKFKKGDCVIYGSSGLCHVVDIKPLRFSPGTSNQLYYVLSPAGNSNSKIFIPAENKNLTKKMRPILTKEEIDSLLAGAAENKVEWIEDRTTRNSSFHEILNHGVDKDLLLMIRCLSLKKKELQENGKKLSSTDDEILKSAEKLVQQEFSYSLEIPQNKVGEYIRTALKKKAG